MFPQRKWPTVSRVRSTEIRLSRSVQLGLAAVCLVTGSCQCVRFSDDTLFACGPEQACPRDHVCVEGVCEPCATNANGIACATGGCHDDNNDGKTDYADASCLNQCLPVGLEKLDLMTDPLNCGECGNQCPAPLHASVTCEGGLCGRGACEPGFFDLDGDATFGCESACNPGAACTGNPDAGCAVGITDCSTGAPVCMDGCALTLVDGGHTAANCSGAGGNVVSAGAVSVCRFDTSDCPTSWRPYLNWSTTSARTATYKNPAIVSATKYCPCTAGCELQVVTCNSRSHNWSNAVLETKTCAGSDKTGYVVRHNSCDNGSCYTGTCTGATSVSVSASRTQVGCY